MNRNSNLIYFNNNRTTALDKTVEQSMLPYLHAQAGKDPQAESIALRQVADLIGAEPGEVLFTRGTTESITLAIQSFYALNRYKGKHIVSNRTEHFAVLDALKALELQGAEITYLEVDREGRVDAEALGRAIRPETIMVSIMAANNETGVLQPLEEISELCRENNIFFFSDGSQFAGKMRCDVKEPVIDGMAFGAHKMHGPEGIGALYISEKYPELLQHARKSCTTVLSAAQKVGFGKAAEISLKDHWENSAHISKLKNYLEHQLLDLEGLRINGSTRHRLYSTSNLSFKDPAKILPLLNRFDFAENVSKPSYVLKAMGLSDEEIRNSFRFSFGKYNTLDEVKLLVDAILG